LYTKSKIFKKIIYVEIAREELRSFNQLKMEISKMVEISPNPPKI
jgi:hypothetical protein